jgi:hypothetical protein
MSEFRPLEANDVVMAENILRGAYVLLSGRPLRRSRKPWDQSRLTDPSEIVRSKVCAPASEAVTVSAHRLGIMATREDHGHHWITSFAPPNEMPSDEDLIACLTHGQFNTESDQNMTGAFKLGYIGVRAEVSKLVNYGLDADGAEDPYGENYNIYYSPESVVSRQIAYAVPFGPLSPDVQNRWLTSKNMWLRSGQVPMGEIGMQEFEQLEFANRFAPQF